LRVLDLILGLLDIRQAELQLITALSTMRNYNNDITLNASSFLVVWKLAWNWLHLELTENY
jgi:hypothetical protein